MNIQDKEIQTEALKLCEPIIDFINSHPHTFKNCKILIDKESARVQCNIMQYYKYKMDD